VQKTFQISLKQTDKYCEDIDNFGVTRGVLQKIRFTCKSTAIRPNVKTNHSLYSLYLTSKTKGRPFCIRF